MGRPQEYNDIIYLPHRVSPTRPHMPPHSRAAQFSPFAALAGYEDAVEEAARLTDEQSELSEDRQELINERLLVILENIRDRPAVSVTFFVADESKPGGKYVTASGFAKHFDEGTRTLILTDGKSIPIADICGVEGDIFEESAFP